MCPTNKTSLNFDVYVILPAAGTGERFCKAAPKQYQNVEGKPLLCYSIEAYEQFAWVKEVVVVADDVVRMLALLLKFNYKKTRLVPGGASRHRSIREGVLVLQNLGVRDSDVVMVHDAVRPFVPADFALHLAIVAHQHGASGAVRPLTSTVVSSTPDGCLDVVLDRSKFMASEMPQAFQYGVLLKAYERCSEHDLDHGTECLHLVDVYAGNKAVLIEGPPDLWKVTYKKDIYAFEGCLKEACNHVCIVAPDHYWPDADEGVTTTNENLLLMEVKKKLLSRFRGIETFRASELCSKGVGSREIHGSSLCIKEHFNSAVFFHTQDIISNDSVFDYAASLAAKRAGIIVHVIDHTAGNKGDGMYCLSARDMHQKGMCITEHYEKFKKTVIIIRYLSCGKEEKVARLVCSLVLEGNSGFGGQTLLI